MRAAFAAILIAGPGVAWTQSVPPPTPIHPVLDKYYDVTVTDNYRWLEDGDSPDVKQWVAAQNAYTASTMDKLPQRDPILAYLKERTKNRHTQYFAFQIRQGRLFALRSDPEENGQKLVVFASPENKGSERRIFDTAKFISGKVFQVDWYRVSPDGKLAGLALSTGGSEDASLYVIDTATGQEVGEAVPRVNFATGGGDMAWTSDSSGFFYTRYPQGDERPASDMNFYQQVYFHTMRTPSTTDRYVLGKDFPRIAETSFTPSPDNSRLLITVANGDGGEYEEFVLTPDGANHQVARFSDKVPMIVFGEDNSLWLLSHRNADTGEIWHLPAGDFEMKDAKLVVASSNASMEGAGIDSGRIFASRDKLYVTVIDGGPEEIRVYSREGKRLPDVATPKVASVGSFVRVDDGTFLFASQTYTAPQQWFRYDGRGQPLALPFRDETDVDLGDIAVERAFATSKDGTKVPLTILMRKGTSQDGKNPAVIWGYGGYGISMKPFFFGGQLGSFLGGRPWFDHGGVVAIANLRGGGEFGEGWHKAGNLTHKQNVFDDFAACAQFLIDQKYTSAEHLVAEGGSNGGLLMGAMITQHPQMFRAIVSYVGIYDMLRVELDPNGAFNTTEFGTVKVPDQFQALYAYSPYHHVASGTKFPAVLFVTGDNDHRVNPAHSRKMTAALQASTASGMPVLLLTNANAGHGFSSDVNEELLQQAEIEAFVFSELGISM